jgi:stage III sporulation protein AB
VFKVAGALLVIVAAGAFGFLVARNYARRPRELRALQSALSLLETEIVYAATPLAEALDQVARRADPCVAGLFARVHATLASRVGTTAQEAWATALDGYYPESCLKTEDLAVLQSIGQMLGASDRQDQAKHLRLAGERLRAQIVKAEEEAHHNVRLWRYLGLFAGLATVLILV